MKALKKLVASVAAIVMALTVFAAPAQATTITITGGASGSEYAAYKLMSATDGGDGKFSYTVNSTYSSILKEVSGKTTDAEVISYVSGLDAAGTRTFADAVYAKVKSMSADYTSSSNSFSGVDQGYYLIVETKTGSDQDTYSLVMLDTAGKDDVSVATKESAPSLEKKVQEKNDSTGTTSAWQDGADYDIGDNVPFKLTGTVSAKYADYKMYKYVFHDTLSNGLTFNSSSVVVKVDGTTIDASNYTVNTSTTDGCSFEIVFNDLKTITGATVTASSNITVEYTAKLNDNAVIGSAGNPNVAKLEYSNNPYDTTNPTTGKTPEDKVIVFTYKLVANKTDKDGNALSGAGFTLYKLIKGENGAEDSYQAVGSEITGVTTFNFTGIDAGTYKLVETTVPAGYNKAEDLVFQVVATYDTDSTDPKLTDITIKDSTGAVISGENKVFTTNLAAGTATTNVVNNSGTELPSTGGIGTTIFYVVGGVLVFVAVVALVAKKRMTGAEQE